ncbi:hypothetical protein QYF61_024338 [Mycteria americana]|uniref:Uncharacterized protein n=1 Tax=Mycteria americana TaxID=33587 RepID=A0AAN7NBG1_MYCAM|nr:hypothetical protein QYF61_024338 [Mycteria americana]
MCEREIKREKVQEAEKAKDGEKIRAREIDGKQERARKLESEKVSAGKSTSKRVEVRESEKVSARKRVSKRKQAQDEFFDEKHQAHGWRLNHFPGQSVPMLDNPFGEEKFPNIQSKPPLAQLEAISSHPITCYLGEETDPHLSTTSFQLRCPSLDTLQHLNVFLVVRGPKPNTVFRVRPHQRRVQGHDHFPSPAGHAIFDTSQDAIGLLGHLGTLLAHIQPAVNQHPQVLLCLAAFQPLFPKPVALHGVAVAQVQDLALSLVEHHTIDLGPLIQPVQIPLLSLPPLQQINIPAQLGVICKHAEGALDPFVQIIDKDIKQNWPQHRALGNTACDWPPTGVNSIHHHSLGPAVQPVLYPAKSTPVQAMSSQFLQENAVGNRVKGFTEV